MSALSKILNDTTQGIYTPKEKKDNVTKENPKENKEFHSDWKKVTDFFSGKLIDTSKNC